MKLKIIIVLIAAILVGLYFCLYTVDEREQAVITQFGRPIGEPIKEPGIEFKFPWQKANIFPKNLMEWDGDPDQIQTKDKRFIWVDAFSRWKIVDPLKFFETVKYEVEAHAILDGILNSTVRNAITSNPLIETVRNTNRELDTIEAGLEDAKEQSDLNIAIGRRQIARNILDEAQPKLEKFGIQLVDIKIKRLNYEAEVQRSVFERMIAERKKIAEKYRSEGKGEARKIEGDMEKEMKKITSEAYKTAQEIKGKADAEATQIYAEAFGKDPEFYSFIQTLDIYKETMDKESSLILSTDSEFLKYFKGYKGKE
ncbi:MAG: protease modulator HflC [Deltaproteobacteria bacterium]|nr:protease modulator HflC [Deltaproteobacteria bacterium]